MTTSRDAIDATLGHFAVAFAYLFGSRVGATAGPRSDWDVAVYLSRLPEEDPIWERFRIEDALARALGSDAVQVIILNRLDAPLLEYEIVSKGQVLCERDAEARLLYESGALRRFHDWRYWLDRHMAASQAGR